MAAATFDRDTRQLGTGAPLNDVTSYPVKAAEKGFGGTIGVHDSSGRAVKAVVATGLVCVGRVEAPFDNTNGADGDVKARILRGIFKWAQGNAGTKIGTSNAAIDLTPKSSGTTARIVVSGNNTALSVGVVGSAITINSATDNGGAATTTGAQALAAHRREALLRRVGRGDGEFLGGPAGFLGEPGGRLHGRRRRLVGEAGRDRGRRGNGGRGAGGEQRRRGQDAELGVHGNSRWDRHGSSKHYVWGIRRSPGRRVRVTGSDEGAGRLSAAPGGSRSGSPA